jgi:hypothetical protein
MKLLEPSELQCSNTAAAKPFSSPVLGVTQTTCFFAAQIVLIRATMAMGAVCWVRSFRSFLPLDLPRGLRLFCIPLKKFAVG